MQTDQLVAYITYLCMVAAISERLVQFGKAVLGSPRPRVAQASYIVESFTFSAIAASILPPPSFPLIANAPIFASAILATAGAGVWHDVLSIVTQYKYKTTP